MEATPKRPRVTLLAAVVLVACSDLVGSASGAAQPLGELQNAESVHTIQFQVNSGSGPFNLWVREGSAAFVMDATDPSSGVIALVPFLAEGGAGEIEVFVYHRSSTTKKTSGQQEAERSTVRLGIGEATYFSVPGLVELVPLSVRTDPLPSTLRSVNKMSTWSGDLADPSTQSLCCITSGGVSTCGCAVEQGGLSCCSPPCCEFFY